MRRAGDCPRKSERRLLGLGCCFFFQRLEVRMPLRFAPANAKLSALETRLGVSVYSFDMLSGVTCPFAQDCHSKAVVRADGTRSIQDGKRTLFRCFSASQEVAYTNVFLARQANTETIMPLAARSPLAAANALCEALPEDAGCVRIHVAGDFKLLNYFDAWLEVAARRPGVRFYAYTKSIPFWVRRLDVLPENFLLTASRGGKADCLIDEHGLREARVVFSEAEAGELGLEIDHDDSHAALPGPSFALLIHGIQPKGSEAGKAVRALRGRGSYSRQKVGA
jgi:hypothetical protein